MNNKELITELSKRLGLTQKQASEMLEVSTSALVSSVTETQSVVFQGFGAFELRNKREKTLLNPATGEKMFIPAKQTLVFKPSDTYKNRVKGR